MAARAADKEWRDNSERQDASSTDDSPVQRENMSFANYGATRSTLCHSETQTEESRDYRLHFDSCDATTQTLDRGGLDGSSNVAGNECLTGIQLLTTTNGMTSSSLTDPSNPSNDGSVITVIDNTTRKELVSDGTDGTDEYNDYGNSGTEDGGRGMVDGLLENNVVPVIHSRGESQSTNVSGRQSTKTRELKRNQSADGADVIPLLCPPGLECLLDASQLVIHCGNLRHDLFFNVRNVRRMEVINELRRVLFYVEQDPPPLFENSFLFRIYDRNKQEVMQIYNPASHTCLACGINWHWLKHCRFQAVVYSPAGTVAGFIKSKRTCFVQEFQILGPCEEVLLRLRGSPNDLEVYSIDLQHELGRLSIHGWVGVMHEIRRTARDYGLTFPIDLDVHVKGLLLASVFVIDWLYLTKGGRKL